MTFREIIGTLPEAPTPCAPRSTDWDWLRCEMRAETVKSKMVKLSDITVPRARLRMLRPEKVDEIATSIQTQQKQLTPIILRPRPRGGYILAAGRHRLEAVHKLKHNDIRAEVHEGLDADGALLIEIDENLIRADLSPAERTLHQAERKRLYEKLHPETKHGGDRKSAKAKSSRLNWRVERYSKDAAGKTGKSERSVQREVERANKIVDLANVVGTSLDEGEELDALAKLPKTEQQKLIKQAKAGKRVTAKHAARVLRRADRERELAGATEAASRELGKKLYGVLYADPPWKFKAYSSATGLDRAPEAHYPTMETAAIAALAVPAAPDCVLFLWATAAHLSDALEVMRAWGFEYKTHIVWKKDKTSLGYWFRTMHEILLVGTRGDVPAPAPGERNFLSVVEAPRGRHSEKPAVFAEMIERLFPSVPKLEMFARKARPGWDCWGNEVENRLLST
jgi:N6-adenosine-specific RNA methylase IME4